MKYAACAFVVLVTAGGWATYALFAWLYSMRNFRFDSLEKIVAGGSTIGAIVGVVAGICYWWALSQWHLGTGSWVPATALGWTVGGALGSAVSSAMYTTLISEPLTSDIYGIGLGVTALVVGAVIGAVTSICQWLVMRARIRRAWRWIVITTAASAIAGFTAWLTGLIVGASIASVTGWAGWAVFVPVGLVTGVIAGGVVVGVATVFSLWLMVGSRWTRPEQA